MSHTQLRSAVRYACDAEEEAMKIYEALAKVAGNAAAGAVFAEVGRGSRLRLWSLRRMLETLSLDETVVADRVH
jgi:rubrerythrin